MKYDFDKVINREKTKCIKWDYNQEIFGVDGLISLWVADMDFEVPRPVQEALAVRTEHPIFGYTGAPDSYYQAFINWMQKRLNWQIEKAWMLSTPGIVPAVNFAIQIYTKLNDKILIQEPVYYPFGLAIENNNRTLVNNPLKRVDNHYKIDFDDLEQKLADDVKMMIFCSPHNPVGRVWNLEELKKVGELCLKYNILLISDEIHADLILNDHKHIPISSISDEIRDNTISMYAPSKTFNLAGLATSTVVISDEKLRVKFQQYLKNLGLHGSNLFGIEAFEAAYNGGEEWLEQLLEYLADNYNFVVEYLKQEIPNIQPIELEGTYLMWLDCSKMDLSQKELVELFVQKAGLGLNDGSKFGIGGEGFMRLNIACSRRLLKEALANLKQAIVSE